MEDVIEKTRQQLETVKKMRVEIEAVLVKNRETVILWLEDVERSCRREIYQLKDNGDIADGEIQTPWNLMQEAISQLRETQELLRISTDTIHEWEAELEEAQHPF